MLPHRRAQACHHRRRQRRSASGPAHLCPQQCQRKIRPRTTRGANRQDPGRSGRLGRPGATRPCPGHAGEHQPGDQPSVWQTLGGPLLPLATGAFDTARAGGPAAEGGCRTPTYRLVFTFDASAAAADARYDGLSVLFTTAPLHHSADELFTKFKEQNYIELLHHQMKTPLAVRPVFLKSPRRVEALVTLLQIALQAYQVLERRYRQTVAADAPANEQRMTAETLLRHFRVYGCIVTSEKVGRVIHATRLTSRQRQILSQLSLPTPAQTLGRILDPVPTG